MTQEDFTTLAAYLRQRVVGQPELIERLLIGLLTGGHLLLEGVPGLAKTTAVRALADGTALRFQRIQFTPDLIPGDITGSDIFVPQNGRFQFVAGPIFSEIILADEINRAPPKVQSALLEAMQERQVTVGGETRPLPEVFLVIATQNPIEQEGTYPLPEAQLDRFFMKVRIDYPSADDELQILHLEQGGALQVQDDALQRTAMLTPERIIAARREVRKIYMDEMVERYIVTLVGATRAPGRFDEECTQWLVRGASPRATIALALAARARAFFLGRDFV
jgi:MoxR-like ATPase